MDHSGEPVTEHVDEPELPQLPPHVDSGPIHARHAQIMSTDAFLLGTSSDPPMFSSDDIAPAAENYVAQRRKHRRVGPWWQQSAESEQRPRKKRKMRRNFDSGVFMGSENSLSSSDMPSSELGRLETPEIEGHVGQDLEHDEQQSPFQDAGSIPVRDDDISGQDIHPRISQETLQRCASAGAEDAGETDSVLANGSAAIDERRACSIIERAIEKGNEDIDLDGELSWLKGENPSKASDLLRPLQYLVRLQRFDDPSRFEDLVPSIRLFLNSNQLLSLPAEIYRLTNITSLSLRNNQLRTLEPFIGNLYRLQRLNLCSNQIRWLPGELLSLFDRSGELLVDDNYLTQPVGSDGESFLARCRSGALEAAASKISYLDLWGNPARELSPRPSRTSLYLPLSLNAAPRMSSDRHQTKSLTELCAAKLSREASPEAPILVSWLAKSKHLLEIVRMGWDIVQLGAQKCSCGREYVIPRAEWFLWLPITSAGQETLIPFLIRNCSWQCAENEKSQWREPLAPESKSSGDAQSDVESDDTRQDAGDSFVCERFECGWKWLP